MKRLLYISSYSLITYLHKDYELTPKNQVEEATNQSVRLVKTFKEKCGIPGVSVHININGKNHINLSFGYCDIENFSKCRPDSLMRIASISKSFTSIIAAKLMEEDLLDFNADIDLYSTSFPSKVIDSKKAIITCQQLLSHRSGIRHYKKNEESDIVEYQLEEFLNKNRFIDTISALKMFQDDDLVYPPGEKYLYSSPGYVLLSAVLEKVAESSNFFIPKVIEKDGKKIKSQKLENMFGILIQKLDLANTHCEYHEKILINRSRQYKRNCKSKCCLESAPYVDNSCKWASGGLVSTCQDLGKFAEHLVKIWIGNIDGIISQKSLRMLWSPVPGNETKDRDGMDESYGLGWSIKNKRDRLYVGHLGGASGGTSALLINVSQKPGCHDYIIVTILCNMENLSENIGFLAEDISKLFECDDCICST